MELFEYIKSQLPHLPNPAIMKNMGASEELIGYVRETVWNTNLGMMKTLGCEAGGGDQGEVWFTSADEEGEVTFSAGGEKTEDGATTNKTYQEWLNLFDNASQYELTLKTACGEWQMQYSEDDGEKKFAPPDEQGVPYISASEYEGEIILSSGAESECLPVQIIVTKK